MSNIKKIIAYGILAGLYAFGIAQTYIVRDKPIQRYNTCVSTNNLEVKVNENR